MTEAQRKPDRLRRNASLALGVTSILASALLTGCTPGGDVIDADYAKVCRDKQTQQRVEDTNCESSSGRSSGHAGWYFLPMGSSGSTTNRNIPAVGQGLSGGVDSIPSTSTSKSAPSKGSTAVSRGGFGGSAKGGAGTNG